MTATGDGERRWDERELDRVEPTSTSRDVTPPAPGQADLGGTGGANQYSPAGELHQQITLARAIGERFGLAGRLVVGVMLLLGVALLVVPVLGLLRS